MPGGAAGLKNRQQKRRSTRGERTTSRETALGIWNGLFTLRRALIDLGSRAIDRRSSVGYASKLKFPGAHVMARWQQPKRRADGLSGTESATLLYYRSHIREACQNDHVICLECGLTFKSLPQHLCKHHLTDDEYKAKWGYNRTIPLVARTTWTGLRRRALAMNLAAYSPPCFLCLTNPGIFANEFSSMLSGMSENHSLEYRKLT